MRIQGKSPRKNFGFFLQFSDEWFSTQGFLIIVLEREFQRLVKTSYFIVNILYNAMKETNRVVKL